MNEEELRKVSERYAESQGFKLNPDKKIVYQMEPLVKNHWWSFDSMIDCLRHYDEVWDYDLDNIEFLKSEGFNNIKHVPFEYVPELVAKNNVKNPEYDILFYGEINDRRAKILSILYEKYKICIIGTKGNFKFYKKYNFGKEMLDSKFNDELYKYIFNSKIIVNIHYYESELQEQVRIFELLINNKIVISEKSKRNYFGDLIYEFEDHNDMINKINFVLKNKIWKNCSVSERFKNKKRKDIKIGVVYNTFYGLELIEKSISSIKDCADYIVIVHQKKGFNGNPEPEINKYILSYLKENKLVDDIVYYEVDDRNVQQGVLNKRNIGLDYCRKNGCMFIMPMDCDEQYNSNEVIIEINNMYENNIDTLYSPIYSYYYDEHHYFKDTYFVPSVFKINDRKFERIKSSVLVDPVRKMQERNYKISDMYMHHYSYLKNSYSNKMNNSAFSVVEDLNNNVKKINDYLLTWKEGKDALVHVNNMKDGGNLVLKKMKLTKK